jgi:hypothetical protein
MPAGLRRGMKYSLDCGADDLNVERNSIRGRNKAGTSLPKEIRETLNPIREGTVRVRVQMLGCRWSSCALGLAVFQAEDRAD